MSPTKKTIEEAIQKIDRIRMAFGKHPDDGDPFIRTFLHETVRYPVLEVWAEAHRPSIDKNYVDTDDAMRGLRDLGFDASQGYHDGALVDQIGIDLLGSTQSFPDKKIDIVDLQVLEGARVQRELSTIKRSKKIVAQAKARHKAVCWACKLDFGEKYGALGVGYIECHHVDQLSGREGIDQITSVDDLALLCSNCHRMVHMKTPCLTVDELRDIIAQAERALTLKRKSGD